MLRQLKRNGDVGRQVDWLPVSRRGMKSYLLRNPPSFLIQPVTQSVDHAHNPNRTRTFEDDFQQDFDLDVQLYGLFSVCGNRLG